MITLRSGTFTQTYFPDNTPHLTLDPNTAVPQVITWLFESDKECMLLYYLAQELHARNLEIRLFMPYVPNARMDRVPRGSKEILTLKWFAQFINSLHFNKVIILDPHSTVTPALINNVEIMDIHPFINDVMREINSQDLTLFAPDEGAVKRYDLEHWGMPYLFGVKQRDWQTRKLQHYDIIGDHGLVYNHDILIIDDIFATGGTMRLAAKALQGMGALNIYAWVSHCENSDNIELPVKKLFTTNSIYTGHHEGIEVFTL